MRTSKAIGITVAATLMAGSVVADDLVRLWPPGALAHDAFLEGVPYKRYEKRTGPAR